MKMKYALIISLTALAALVSAPLAIAAGGHGHGFHGHSGHFSNHFRPARHQNNFSQLPLYGGLYALPPYSYDNNYIANGYASSPTVIFVAEPPRALTCHYSQQTKTVPSEDGGTRDITITRC